MSKGAIAATVDSLFDFINPPDIGYWVDTSRIGVKPCAKIRFTSKLLEKPLMRENLKQDTVLNTLAVIRQPNATNYKITQQEE